MKKLLFENETCSRCCGVGRYSWNAITGDRCFKCGGSGATLTKRGHVAQEFLRQSRMIPANQLKVGDVYLSEGFQCGSISQANRAVTITEIKDAPPAQSTTNGVTTSFPMISINGIGSGLTTGIDAPVRVLRSKEAERALIDAALSYQASLTKMGKLRKTKAVA